MAEMTSNLSEDEQKILLSKTAEKDKRAFETLYRDYFHRLQRFFNRSMRQDHNSEDLINEVMHIVWQKADTFRGEAKVSTWIFGIAYRQGLKAIQRAKKHRSDQDIDEALDKMATFPIEEYELKEMFDKALSSLSVQHRTVIELTFQQGYSYAEIGKILDIPENTVKTRMFHAKKLIKRILPNDIQDTLLQASGNI